jgi:hypothetical protein
LYDYRAGAVDLPVIQADPDGLVPLCKLLDNAVKFSPRAIL